MKFLTPTLAICLWIYGNSCLAQSAQELFTEAQRAYVTGDVRTAETKFKRVLILDPNNKSAQGYLRMIAAQQRKSGVGGGDLQRQLQTLVLPKIELREATFGSALEYLKQQAEKQGARVSFVVQLPPEFVDSQKVTLNLANIPFTEAVRYLCELVHVKFSVEQFAIVIKK
jgi:hypothetical protein